MIPNCFYPGCDRESETECDLCSPANRFCSDHGTKGGDHQIQEVGAVAYPSRCADCGGFNADE